MCFVCARVLTHTSTRRPPSRRRRIFVVQYPPSVAFFVLLVFVRYRSSSKRLRRIFTVSASAKATVCVCAQKGLRERERAHSSAGARSVLGMMGERCTHMTPRRAKGERRLAAAAGRNVVRERGGTGRPFLCGGGVCGGGRQRRLCSAANALLSVSKKKQLGSFPAVKQNKKRGGARQAVWWSRSDDDGRVPVTQKLGCRCRTRASGHVSSSIVIVQPRALPAPVVTQKPLSSPSARNKKATNEEKKTYSKKNSPKRLLSLETIIITTLSPRLCTTAARGR